MKYRSRLLLALVVAGLGCGRIGYVGGGDDGGDGDATEPVTKLDSGDAGAHRDAGKDAGTTHDGGITHPADAHDAGGSKADAAADAPDQDGGSGKDSGGAKDTGVDVDAGCASECVTLQPGTPTTHCLPPGGVCAECTGGAVSGAGFVCGDGVSYSTAVNSSYPCTSAGTLGTGTPCAFGCDNTTGACKDLVAANAAGANLQTSDHFTCTGTQDTTLAAIGGANGDVIAFDTSAPSVTKNGSTIAALWGTAYMPTDGETSVIVAHVRGVSLGPGAVVRITGTNALVLLVDLGVAIGGPAAPPTVVDLSAHYSSIQVPLAGPGSNTIGQGGSGTITSESGGGGGGHGVPGGAGGSSGTTATLAAGGIAYGSRFLLEAGAMGGGLSSDLVGKGGGGLQISTCGDISIGADVLINGSGGGGTAGVRSAGGTEPPGGGYGGGSGGTIILEGATASSLEGALVANGGGGGEGAIANSQTAGANGSDWPTTGPYNGVAPGGGAAGAGVSGSGGAGGAGMIAPVSGSNAPAGSGGGAGGGAFGAIFIGVSPLTATPNASTASPAPYYSKTCTTVGGVPPTPCSY